MRKCKVCGKVIALGLLEYQKYRKMIVPARAGSLFCVKCENQQKKESE